MASSVCRVCLVVNIRMLNITNIHLLEIYEKLTNDKLNIRTENGMPSTICYVCHRVLQKCHRFSDMAHKSNRILQDLLRNVDEETQNKIEMASLKSMQYLMVTPTQHMSINTCCSTSSSPVTVKEEVVMCKEKTGENGVIDDGIFKLEAHEENVEIDVDLNKTELSQETDNNVERQILLTEEKSYACNKCNKAFTNKTSLKIHMHIHTRDKPHSSNRCNKASTTKSHLKEHTLIHTEDKPFSCNMCNKAFTQKRILNVHMLSHSGDKPYSCSMCNKAFTKKSGLMTHMLIHTGDKPYSCSMCNKAFSQKSTLKGHMLIHTGDKPYSCSICNKAFTQKCTLNVHMLIHTGDKPYSCNT